MRKAFTLVEVCVVAAILAALVAILLPSIQAVRDAARRAQAAHGEAEKLRAFLEEKIAEAKKVFDGDSEEVERRRDRWVQQQLDYFKNQLEEEKQRHAEEVNRLQEEARESWRKFWKWCRDLGRNALFALLGLIGILIAAWIARPLSRGIAAIVIRRQAPRPRRIRKLDEDA